jgi:hypothetical protein
LETDNLLNKRKMGATLNKDGTPRKIGSGKTKGAGCYEKISLRELRKLVGEETEVSVSRVWLRSAQSRKNAIAPKVELKLPNPKPPKPTENLNPLAITEESKSKINDSAREDTNPPDKDDYEPPPLFASNDGIRNY